MAQQLVFSETHFEGYLIKRLRRARIGKAKSFGRS
jgi:hypothetical protein